MWRRCFTQGSSGTVALPPASAWEGRGRCCSLETFHVSLLLGVGCAHQHYRWVPCKCQTCSCTAQGLWAVCSSPLFVSLPARTHLGFHQLPAHCGPLSPRNLILTTPAPLQSSESHPHLASIRPGELWTRPTRFMPATVHSHSFHGKLGGIKVYCEEKLELTINQLGHLGIKLNWTWDLGSTMESNSFFGMVRVLDHGNKTQNSRHLPSLPIDSGLAILKHSKGWGKYCSLGFWSECRPSIQQSYFVFLLSKKSLRCWTVSVILTSVSSKSSKRYGSAININLTMEH